MDQKPLFTFAQWTDLHVQPTEKGGYALANEKTRYLVDQANQAVEAKNLDFVVSTGDMINNSGNPAADFVVLKSILKDLKCPYYPVAGNHETCQGEWDDKKEKDYVDAYGAAKLNYTFVHKGIEFVVMNDSGAPMSNDDGGAAKRHAWLKGVLEGSDLPKIICCHIPVFLVREEETLSKSFGFVSYAVRNKDFEDLIKKHSDRVIAVISGHLHLTGMKQWAGVTQVVVSGSAAYPCEWATYEVYKDKVKVKIQSLPNDLVTPQTNIFGPPLAIAYTDEEHPTHGGYVRGNAGEREFEILNKMK